MQFPVELWLNDKLKQQDGPHETRSRCEAAGTRSWRGGVLTRGKVVLFYPPYDGPAAERTAVSSVARGPLREAGF